MLGKVTYEQKSHSLTENLSTTQFLALKKSGMNKRRLFRQIPFNNLANGYLVKTRISEQNLGKNFELKICGH